MYKVCKQVTQFGAKCGGSMKKVVDNELYFTFRCDKCGFEASQRKRSKGKSIKIDLTEEHQVFLKKLSELNEYDIIVLNKEMLELVRDLVGRIKYEWDRRKPIKTKTADPEHPSKKFAWKKDYPF